MNSYQRGLVQKNCSFVFHSEFKDSFILFFAGIHKGPAELLRKLTFKPPAFFNLFQKAL
jgi:hypothetical protein